MPCYMDALEDSEALKKTAYIDDSTIASFYQVQDPSNVNGCILRNDWLQELGMDEPVTYEDTHNVLLAMQSELGIEHMGWRVMTVTGPQVFNADRFETVAKEAASRIGKRLRTRVFDATPQRNRLRHELERWMFGT